MNFKDSEILVAKLSKLCPGVPVDEEQAIESAFFCSIRDNMDAFKAQLRSLRKKHSKTQVDIAKYLGITQAAYSGWESGSVIPKASALKELAEYYDEDPSVFLNLITDDELEYTDSVPVLVKEDLDNCSYGQLCEKLFQIKSSKNMGDRKQDPAYQDNSAPSFISSVRFRNCPASSGIDYYFEIPDDSMYGTLIKGSLISVNLSSLRGLSNKQLFSLANNKVALLSIDNGPVMLRRVFFEGDLVTLVASNPNLASRAFPLEKNNGVLSSISDKINFFSSRGGSIITADSITVLGIAKEMIVELS